MKKFSWLFPFLVILSLTGCKKDKGLNIFTKSQDLEFGKQMKESIDSSPEFNVLSADDYPEAYEYLNRIKNTILNNAEDIDNKDVFAWEVYIIDDDILNAFACPGGFMYFYTGLINYLEDEAEFAGVMAHEMAHVELRHSTQQMTQQYGYSTLLSILLGDPDSKLDSIVRGVAGGLANLKFSRNDEAQSDEFAVKFLADTEYDPTGVAGFFEKLKENSEGSDGPPAFLRTHPLESDRIDNIYSVWEEEGSPTGNRYPERYQEFKNSLP